MHYTTLGRTGLRVSVAGLGCGGPSRLGQSTGRSEDESIAVVKTAIDSGINLLDTAEVYGTEEIVGKAIAGLGRDDVVVATKAWWQNREGGIRSASGLGRSLDRSLSKLQTDRVDIYFLHGVTPDVYEDVRDALVPALERFRADGKVRFIGVTEHFGSDTRHEMLRRALHDDWIDVVMLGFSILNQSARDTVFPLTREKGVGTLDMFAVRRALSRLEDLRALVDDLSRSGLLDGELDPDDPLGFLVHEGGAVGTVDAAYRFCRDEPGIDVVLTGTGSIEHLKENVTSLERPSLPDADLARLRDVFGRVDSVSGN